MPPVTGWLAVDGAERAVMVDAFRGVPSGYGLAMSLCKCLLAILTSKDEASACSRVESTQGAARRIRLRPGIVHAHADNHRPTP
jgi:hypothetical protein